MYIFTVNHLLINKESNEPVSNQKYNFRKKGTPESVVV